MVTSFPGRWMVDCPMGNDVIPIRDFATRLIQRGVFDEQDRVIGADGSFQQSLGICRRPRRDNLQAGEMGKDRIRRLGMGGAQLAPAAAHSADHQRQDKLPTKHIMQLGCLVNDMIHGRESES